MIVQINFENHFKLDKGNDCLISVDGTNFLIPEHEWKFYSYKFRKSGLQYEIALCILTGDIVWINGPYEAGIWNNLTIFHDALFTNLEPNERVEANNGYIGEHPQFVKCPAEFTNPAEMAYMQQWVQNWKEAINERFKNFDILKQSFQDF